MCRQRRDYSRRGMQGFPRVHIFSSFFWSKLVQVCCSTDNVCMVPATVIVHRRGLQGESSSTISGW
jgi:hypothetical protein